ncbi:hypothetical protein FTX61_02630 [Nitriliruptoraceae bacterium ZYF776]|nr:hypothetical protein [Profundirhabdus halotolerans]
MPVLGHVVLHVRDLARSKGFYGDLLGLRELGPYGSDGVVYGGGRLPAELVLLQVPTAGPVDASAAGPAVVAFHLDDGDDAALWALHDRLVEAGSTVDGVVDDGLTHALHVTDPDGVAVAVTVTAVDEEIWRRRPDLRVFPPRPLTR